MKITEVITLDSSDDDATTVAWENSISSSDDDIEILKQRIRSRKTARVYSDKIILRTTLKPKASTMITSRIYSNSSFPNSSTRINSKTCMGSQSNGSLPKP